MKWIVLLLVVLALAIAAAKPSAYPTKARTAKPSKRPTSTPTSKPSKRPTPKPSKRPTTPKPTILISSGEDEDSNQCSTIQTPSACSVSGLECEWYAPITTNYLVKPKRVVQFHYGCQSKAHFCAFTQGTVRERELQCNAKNFPCMWKATLGRCIVQTRAPSPPPAPHTQCSNACLSFANNGVCDDGGEASQSKLCFLGTDCADCGARIIA